MDDETREVLKKLPAVDEAVRDFRRQAGDDWPHWAVVQAVRDAIARQRERILDGSRATSSLDAGEIHRRLGELLTPSLRPVINAAGVVLHTNLGRAPLPRLALERIEQVARGYSTLEYDLGEGRRGSRHQHLARILCQLCGAEDAVVVNNNAAAVLLCLAAWAADREVVVSRGELVEIGGSFRMPDVMAAAGVQLREVGTTNRTHLRDYERALCDTTGLLLKVHRSNFRLLGFTAEVAAEELAALGQRAGVRTMYDLGSGTLLQPREHGIGGAEHTVPEMVAAGFDLVTFSGDKLLGGPQAGVVVGRADAVDAVRRHPLMRVVRPDKLCLAALTATLELYRDGRAKAEVPAWQMIVASSDQLRGRAQELATALAGRLPRGWEVGVEPVDSRAGGGSLPGMALRSWAVGLAAPGGQLERLERALRRGAPPVVARIEDDRLWLDVRTIADTEREALVDAVERAAAMVDDDA